VQMDSTPPQPRIFPGGEELIRFRSAEHLLRIASGLSDRDTEGNPYLDSFLSAVTGIPISGAAFSRDSIALIDQYQQAIGTDQALEAGPDLAVDTVIEVRKTDICPRP
jgi:hypothetical protein